ncbi:MAG: 4Fe-4S binding protein [Chromatiaceae bacterium]|nr:4Fe-4S binding protein [Chromatiaceae bacterium]
MAIKDQPGRTAIETQGWIKAHKWLLARRASQLGILALFLLGPLAGIWLIKGNLSASMVLDAVPLTDPMLLLQAALSGTLPVLSGLIGAAIVLLFYALVGGRVFCSWVCPVNMITDLAARLRRRLDLRNTVRLSRDLRYWILGLVLLLPLVTGVIAWEYRSADGPARLVRPPLSGGGLLRADRLEGAGTGGGRAAREVRRLHGLLRRLPRAAGHQAGLEGGRQGSRSRHPRYQLHQLRALPRRLLARRLRVRHALRECHWRTGGCAAGAAGVNAWWPCERPDHFIRY